MLCEEGMTTQIVIIWHASFKREKQIYAIQGSGPVDTFVRTIPYM